MAFTYEPISTQTLGSNTSSITFSSIPGTYTDLIIVAVFGQITGDDLQMRYNGDSSSIYSSTRMVGQGSSVTGSITTGYQGMQPRFASGTPTTLTPAIWIENIQNYANTTTFKTDVGRLNTNGQTEAHVGLWRSTAAITSVTMLCQAQSFTTGSTFTLYGIKAA